MIRPIKQFNKNETAVLLKHGNKQAAILYWWGRASTSRNDWEREVVSKWVREDAKENKSG